MIKGWTSTWPAGNLSFRKKQQTVPQQILCAQESAHNANDDLFSLYSFRVRIQESIVFRLPSHGLVN